MEVSLPWPLVVLALLAVGHLSYMTGWFKGWLKGWQEAEGCYVDRDPS